jgi:hypothetical protein
MLFLESFGKVGQVDVSFKISFIYLIFNTFAAGLIIVGLAALISILSGNNK